MRVFVSILILAFLVPINFVAPHSHVAHGVSTPVDHATHPHIHLGNHTHSHPGHHHHDEEPASGERETLPSDHDSDAVYIVAADMAPPTTPTTVESLETGTYQMIDVGLPDLDSILAAWSRTSSVHGPPDPSDGCPIYLLTLCIRC